MPSQNAKYRVKLTVEQRTKLEAVTRLQSVGAARHRRARILLMADENHPDGHRPDRVIAEAVGICERQVVRIRQRFVREGDAALDRQPLPPRETKLDGAAEARLVSICCSAPPEGRERWTLQLLCDELVRLKVVTSICRETVRKHLKKMS